MNSTKKLSNAFSTGGGGVHFEVHVQASFVVLMLTNGRAPYFPDGNITEINLQGKVDGYDTDDLIVTTKNLLTNNEEKLLVQVKSSIKISPNKTFEAVMQAAWNDFNNAANFNKGADKIALITGPLSKQDTSSVQWVLECVKYAKDCNDFFSKLRTPYFCSNTTRNKLKIIREALKKANKGIDVDDETTYEFLKHFYWFGYDLGSEGGVELALFLSHIAQFESSTPQWLWSRIVDFIMTANQNAGTITSEDIPSNIMNAFTAREPVGITSDLKQSLTEAEVQWENNSNATLLALCLLLGSWSDKNENDRQLVSDLFGFGYEDWQKKAQEILNTPNSPLSINKNGIWKINDRKKLWQKLAPSLLDSNIDLFQSLSIAVLSECDPSFDLPTEDRYMASIHNKILKYSAPIRKGIAEGLALLGNNPEACKNCSLGKAEYCAEIVINEIFSNADWLLWGSLDGLLPDIAEASPSNFLLVLDRALSTNIEIFKKLFEQETTANFGQNYLTGLLWALEALAWKQENLIQASVILAKLDGIDPGGNWANRPLNSLIDILLPWHPQTYAPIEKRKIVVDILFKKYPDVAWKVILALLPNSDRMTSGTYKPRWMLEMSPDWKPHVSHEDYRAQVLYFLDIAIEKTEMSLSRLASLLEVSKNFSDDVFDNYVEKLSSDAVLNAPDSEKQIFWEKLSAFIQKNKRFSDTSWALDANKIIHLEFIAERFVPVNIFALHKQLFSGNDFDLFDELDNYEEQQKILYQKRANVIQNIFHTQGINGVIEFNEIVNGNFQVGAALGEISDTTVDHILIPRYLCTSSQKQKNMINVFIEHRYKTNSLQWVDSFNVSIWEQEQLVEFLKYLPFVKETWDKATLWLDDETLYWQTVVPAWYRENTHGNIAVEKLLQVNRPHAAIDVLYGMTERSMKVEISQCVSALYQSISSEESIDSSHIYHIEKIIGFAQENATNFSDELAIIEFAYIKMFRNSHDIKPKTIMLKLSKSPSYFCEVIQLIYRSKFDAEPKENITREKEALVSNAWNLLRIWNVIPGIGEDGILNSEVFDSWLGEVIKICEKSGHLDIALHTLGEVLIHAPADPSGLWIHKTIANALDDNNAEKMRIGYKSARFNARGVYTPDPAGTQEMELAAKYKKEAEEVENEGFINFASTLRKLADEYELDAKRVIEMFNDRYQE